MSKQVHYAPLGEATIGSVSPFMRETRDYMLASDKEELASLRFSIILTARWESSGSEYPEHRSELRADLDLLRKHYGAKIDEIAMTFGVEEAMKAKEEVERNVSVPREMGLFTPSSLDEEFGPSLEEEFGAGGYEL